jgi:hypothetical protein
MHPALAALRLAAALFAAGNHTRREFSLNSECVASVVYDDGDITVKLHSGHEYPITEGQAAGLLSARSPGQFFNTHIRTT